MLAKSLKQIARDKIMQARRRAGYRQREVAHYLGITTEQYREIERVEKKLLPDQIDFLKVRLNFKEVYIAHYEVYWKSVSE
ncbi:helix-turn-helix transcriptional regulator (plasmid) [Paenibacillus peoriae]|uniref:Helix-turn-helix transcriptional regulator n=1 Tax=Paenibacillus peoriae TaxID=59893 RepID=A0A7H0YH28_9BACL|nr:helix-turn-helix transcriptional regulator [Paenibacillus peoriae]QNR70386.1 helix-turn-helix transcriptional regulator [Paenibacillus peoriae]